MSFIRGSELVRHRLSMLMGTMSWALLCALMAIAVWSWMTPPFLSTLRTTDWIFYAAYWFARACLALDRPDASLPLPTSESGYRLSTVSEIAGSETIHEFATGLTERLIDLLFDASLAGVFGIGTWMLITGFVGYSASKDRLVAGTNISGMRLFVIRQVLTWWLWSPYAVAQIRLPRNGETVHILVVGSTGAGKTTAIRLLLDQIRARGDMAIVLDPDGTYTSYYYRDGHDVLLNPLDSRMPSWTPWAECQEPQHFDDFAEGLIARDPREAGDSIWDVGAAQFIAGALQALEEKGMCTNANLYEFLATQPLEEIETLLQGLPAGVVMNTAIERTALSVRFTAMKRVAVLRHLSDVPTGDPFSIREFVASGGNKWLFLSSRADMRATLRPLLTAWLHLATMTLLSLPPSPSRRVWFILDEVTSLSRLSALLPLMQEGRKFGACVVVGLHSQPQLASIYGEADATTMMSLVQTTLALRTPDYKTAELMARRLGEQVFFESRESTQYGAHPTRDGVSLSQQYTKRYLVEPAELQLLPDRTGYLRLPGPSPLVRVTLPIRQRQPIAEPFMPLAMFPDRARRTTKVAGNGEEAKKSRRAREAEQKNSRSSSLSELANDLAEPEP